MNGLLFFISGLIVGIILTAFLYIKRIRTIYKENEDNKYPPITDADRGLGVETIKSNQEAKTIKLQPIDKKLTGCVENDVVVVSFYLPDMFPELLNEKYPKKSTYYSINEVRENFIQEKLTKIALIGGCEMDMFRLLVNGRVKIYSKIDTNLVNEIRYCGKSEIRGRLSGNGSFKFYLPSGKLFLEIPTWIS